MHPMHVAEMTTAAVAVSFAEAPVLGAGRQRKRVFRNEHGVFANHSEIRRSPQRL